MGCATEANAGIIMPEAAQRGIKNSLTSPPGPSTFMERDRG